MQTIVTPSGDNLLGGPAWSTMNHGTQTTLDVGLLGALKTRGILRFNLSAIPAVHVCISAILKLYHRGATWASQTANNTINLYEIADDNGDWVEGTQTDAEEAGSSCYAQKAFGAPGTNWAGSAGLMTAGTDYVNAALADAVSFPDGFDGWRTFTLNAAGRTVLKDNFGGAAPNGLLIIGDEATSGSMSQILSRHWANSDYWPQLIIEHGSPDNIGTPCIVV